MPTTIDGMSTVVGCLYRILFAIILWKLCDRQTISKWELAQSYPDFQRFVLLSDYFEMSLDALVKDVDVQDIQEKNVSEKQLNVIYNDISTAKSTVKMVMNVLCVIGVVGIVACIFAGVVWG